MPSIIRAWLQLVSPHRPKIESWEQLDTLDEPAYVKVFLDTGEKILIKQEGSWISTWRYSK